MRWTLLIFATCCGIGFAQVPKPGSVTVNLSTIPCVSTPPQISAPLGTLCYIGPAIYLCTGAVNVTTCSVPGDWTLQPSSGAVRTGSITVVPLATPAAPSVTSTCVGTCATTYSYGVVAYLPDGSSTQVGALTTITSGPASLAAYPNHIVLPGETGATSCALARMSGGATTGVITSTIGSLCNASIVDDGLTASGSSPAVNTTGLVTGTVEGNAATATALAANGANCSAGNFAAGVDASGAAEGCAVPAGTYSLPTASDSVKGGVTMSTATSSVAVATDDARNNNSRFPTAHASSHQNGGNDEIATATPAANAIPKAGSGGTLASGWIPIGTTSSTVSVGNDPRFVKRILWSNTFMDTPESDATSGYRAFGTGGATTYFSFDILADWPGALTLNLTGWSTTATLAPTITI